MARKIVTITHPDGTKKVIVGKQSTSQPTPVDTSKPVSIREEEKDRRPKPGTPKIGISHERNGYKNGGKIKLKVSKSV